MQAVALPPDRRGRGCVTVLLTLIIAYISAVYEAPAAETLPELAPP